MVHQQHVWQHKASMLKKFQWGLDWTLDVENVSVDFVVILTCNVHVKPVPFCVFGISHLLEHF
jgi:hypothetical protein